MKEKGCILMSPREIDRLGILEKVTSKQLTQAEAARLGAFETTLANRK